MPLALIENTVELPLHVESPTLKMVSVVSVEIDGFSVLVPGEQAPEEVPHDVQDTLQAESAQADIDSG